MNEYFLPCQYFSNIQYVFMMMMMMILKVFESGKEFKFDWS